MNGKTTININGKDVDLKFGMYSFRVLAEKLTRINGYDGESLNEAGISAVLHAGYLNNCVVKEVNPELTFEDFFDFVENAIMGDSKDQITEAISSWTQSQFMQTTIANNKKVQEEAKKKPTGTKSTGTPLKKKHLAK